MRQYRERTSSRMSTGPEAPSADTDAVSNQQQQLLLARFSGEEFTEVVDLILSGQHQDARRAAAELAQAFRAENRSEVGDAHPITDILGELWQLAECIDDLAGEVIVQLTALVN